MERENPGDTRSNQMLKWWNYVRWLSTISFLSVGILLMSMQDVELPEYSFIFILLGIMLLNFAYSYWLDNFIKKKGYIWLHNFLDISIFSLAIYMTGGVKSPLIWIYLIPILTSSITIGRGAGLWASFVSMMGLFLLLFMFDYHQMTNIALFPALVEFIHTQTHTLLSYACLFLLVYFISSFLASTLRLQNVALENLNRQLDRKNEELVISKEKNILMEKKRFADKLARTLQHELNNPLAILSINSELLMKEEGQTYFERITSMQKNITRMKTILKKIDQVYRSDNPELISTINSLDIEKFDLSDNPITITKH